MYRNFYKNSTTDVALSNYPSGRSDWEMLGRRNSGFDNRKYLVEFKYFSNTEAGKKKLLSMKEAATAELNQIRNYENDNLTQFPRYKIVKAVIYIAGNKGFRFFYDSPD